MISCLSACIMLLLSASADAQLLKRIRNEVKSRTENKVVREVGDATDRTLDGAKEGVTGATSGAEAVPDGNQHGDSAGKTATVDKTDYRSYDFVPGDKIIFEPDLSEEPDAELPARFSIKRGNAEIQQYEGEKVLHLDAGGYATVTPLMDPDDYLPEQFTVEFDMMYENKASRFEYTNDFTVLFLERGDENFAGYGKYRFVMHSNEQVSLGAHGTSFQRMADALQKAVQTNNVWHHIALYVRGNIAKAYVDQYRVAASNTIPTGAGKLAICTDGRYGFKIKNFRLAAGGDDKYKKIITDGKFVTRGIRFDVAKATIRPESAGAIHEIVKLMKDHTDLKFEIGGHTDSDGNANTNFQLSQARAEAVKNRLMEMGIETSRLTTRGFGASMPIDDNATEEGKANNRRVEFVKL